MPSQSVERSQSMLESVVMVLMAIAFIVGMGCLIARGIEPEHGHNINKSINK